MNKFYEYRQNNSGGSFYYDENVCVHVFVEAKNHGEANGRAEALGIYFNGCDSGQDCNCCGDRWYPVDEDDAEESVELNMKWDAYWPSEDGTIAVIHYRDGKKMRVKIEYEGDES